MRERVVAVLIGLLAVTGVGLAGAPSAHASASPVPSVAPSDGYAGCIVVGSFALCIPYL